MCHTQDKCELEIVGADYNVTKEFIVKLLPVSAPRQRWGAWLANQQSGGTVFPTPKVDMPFLRSLRCPVTCLLRNYNQCFLRVFKLVSWKSEFINYVILFIIC